MSFIEAIKTCFKKYANGRGRARRSEYWFFSLFCLIIVIIALIVDSVIGLHGVLYCLVILALSIPNVSAGIRRMHDTGLNGIMILIPIANIIWLCTDSQPGPNKYGDNPKENGAFKIPGAVSGSNGNGMGNNVTMRVDSSNIGLTMSPAAKSPASVYGVQCLEGPLQGQIFQIPINGIMIGRDSACGILFPNDTQGVSSRHCTLSFQNNNLMLTDVGSSFGTYLEDGTLLQPMSPHPMRPNMRFYLGSQEVCLIVFC